MKKLSLCRTCGKDFTHDSALNHHISLSPACRQAKDSQERSRLQSRRRANETAPSVASVMPSSAPRYEAFAQEPLTPSSHPDLADIEPVTVGSFDQDAKCPPHRQPTVEDIPEDGCLYIDSYPTEAAAGANYGLARTSFEVIRDDQIIQGGEIWGPFEDEDEWQTGSRRGASCSFRGRSRIRRRAAGGRLPSREARAGRDHRGARPWATGS